MAEIKTQVLIIGSGPAGLTAGIYAARAGFSPIVVSGAQVGGQLITTTEVENFPGFENPILGVELMQKMQQQAINVGVEIISDTINEIDFIKYPFECITENDNIISAQSIIIATGAAAKWLDIKGEQEFKGHGVSACATCDGFFYRNKNVAVIGGGSSAVEEALFLSQFVKNVTLIHRRDSLRAEKVMIDKILNSPKVCVQWDCVVEEVLGQNEPKSVTGLKLKNLKTDTIFDINVDGVFVAIGHHPNTEIFKNQIELDEQGYIKTKPGSSATNIAGVFACGDVKEPQFRQAIVAAGSGCVAALEAEKYLLQKK